MRKLKLPYDIVEQAVQLKRDGLCDADIIAALGVHQSTFYRWLKEGEEAKSGVKRALCEELRSRIGRQTLPGVCYMSRSVLHIVLIETLESVLCQHGRAYA